MTPAENNGAGALDGSAAEDSASKWVEEQRARLQEALAHGEGRLGAVLRASLAAVYLKDPEGRYLELNRLAEIMLGVDRERILGKTDRDLFPEETAAALRSTDLEALRAETPLRFEHRFSRDDGASTYEATKFPLTDPSGSLRAVCAVATDITWLKRAEDALQESEERFRVAFEDAPVGISLVGVDRRFLWVNRAMCGLLGYPEQEMLSKTLPEIVHPDDLEELGERVRQALEGEIEGFTLETRILDSGKGAAWHLISVSLIRDRRGEPGYFVCVHQDLSERKRVEARLKLLESVAVNATDAVIITEAWPLDDPGPRIVYVNEAFTRMTGYEPEEVIGGTPRTMQGARTDRLELDRVREALSRREPVRVEVINYRKDGSEFWAEMEISPVADETGRFTHWISVQRDTTERREAEEAMRESRSKFRAVFDRAATGMALVDAKGMLLETNPALQEMLGYGGDELLGKHFADLTHPEDVAADEERFRELMAGEIDQFRLEKRYVRKDGSLRWGRLTSSSIRGVEARPRFMIGMVEDVTDRRVAQEALRESEERHRAVMEQSVEAIFLYDVEELRVIESNGAFQRMVGYAESELKGMKIYDFIAHERGDIDANVARTLREGRRHIGDRRYRRKDGSEIIVDTSASVIRYQGRQAICAVSRDVTERRRLEEELKENEGRFRSLIQNAQDIITILDAGGTIRYESPSIESVLGYQAGELIGKRFYDFVHADDLGRVDGAFAENVQTPGGILGPVEFRFRHKNGRWRYLESVGSNLLDAPGIGGMVANSRDVTGRREAEEALRESEERYRRLVETSPDTIAVHSEGTIVFVNAAAVELLGGTSPLDLIGKPVMDFVHPDYQEAVKSRIRETEQRARSAELIQEKFVRLDGVAVDVEVVTTPITYGGKPAVQVIARDITERVRAEEAIRESEERFRNLVQNASDIVKIVDPDGTLRYASPAFERVFGYDPERSVGMNVLDLVHPDDLPRVLEEAGKAMEQSGVARNVAEYRFRHADGSWRYVESVGTYLLDEPSIRGVVINVRDLTERKAAERALRESEERFRSLIQHSSDVVAMMDADGKNTYVSPAVERILGYRPEERIGRDALELIHTDDLERTRDAFSEALRTPGSTLSIGMRLRHKDGSWRHLETTGTNLLDHPSVRAVVFNTRDVTERVRAAEALRESERRFRAVIEQVMDGIYLGGVESRRILDSNKALQDMLGYTGEELRGMEIYDVIAHEREDVDAVYANLLEAGNLLIGERRYRRKDGSTLEVEASATVVSYGGTEIVCWVVRDITERKRAEEALRRSEASLAEAQRLARLGNWEWDVRTGEAHWSDETFRIYGYEPQEFVPSIERMLEIVHPDDAAMLEEKIEGALYRDEPYDFHHRIVRPDGEVRVVHRQAVVVFDEEGEPVRMIGTAHDVTERREAEEELARERTLLRTLIDNTPDPIFVKDAVGRYAVNNLAHARSLGVEDPADLVGHTDFEHFPHERAERYRSEDLRVLRSGRPMLDREESVPDENGGTRWYLTTKVPLLEEDGEAVGLVGIGREITERKDMEEQLRHQAFHDALTGLPNRALFLDRLEHALARAGRVSEPVAVLFIDLDDFKKVNDSLGHEAGNRMLVSIARGIKACVRPGDTVARLFGDEFAVLLEAPTGADEARRVAERIIARVQEPFGLAGQEVYASACVGIALSENAEDGSKDLLRRADLAMYEAKRRGKSGYEIFRPSMDVRADERLSLENELRRAVERGEFEVFYQPIVEVATGRVAEVEALVRWRHPERGLVAPSDFIVLAEETGLIRPIGGWVVEEACRQAREWSERFPDDAPVVAVNLSTSQFSRQSDLIPKILGETGLDPACLRLEITERAVMDDAEFSLGKLERLRDLGVTLAMDDYGMGYSCLFYLKRMPLDVLKIDREFIAGLGRDSGDEAIVEGTIGLAHALGLKIVGEGVETAEQLSRLREMGCDLAQGFHLARPLPADDVAELLSRGRLP